MKIDIKKMSPGERLYYSELVEKYNPYHDSKGRFAPRNGAKGYSIPRNSKNLKAEDPPEGVTIHRSGADGKRVKQTSIVGLPDPPPQAPKKPVKPTNKDYNTSTDLVRDAQWTKVHKTLGFDHDLDKAVTMYAKPFIDKYGNGKSLRMGNQYDPSGRQLFFHDDYENQSHFGANDPKKYTHSTRDKVLQAIYKKQGYDAKPEKLSKKDFDAYLKANKADGAKELFRFVGSKASADQFRDGSYHFAGDGIFGNGTYTGDHRWKRGNPRATAYGNNGIRMALKPGAKVITDYQLKKEHNKFLNDPKIDSRDKITFGTPTRYAAGKGYDAVKVPKNENTSGGTADYFILLNRGAVIVDGDFN